LHGIQIVAWIETSSSLRVASSIRIACESSNTAQVDVTLVDERAPLLLAEQATLKNTLIAEQATLLLRRRRASVLVDHSDWETADVRRLRNEEE
jgi:hypothetical protein